MNNLSQFLKDELINRALAARELKADLKVNDIFIKNGCSSDGIEILSGIEKLAEIIGEELKEDVYAIGGYTVNELWFCYGTEESDIVKFYQREYIKMPDPEKSKTNPAARGEF